ncbi:hypothetical protein HAHE_06630 [Haloferula helveola]|uniref:Type II secretion system protein GspG C-terminal domain-containing protein n=1 Tax=Haloferula helveola TaxID=490095 RepID=A0ABN6GZU5_9BACT|nr:hypothetical protein HAHE_06630 [Haloferula helveola]
MRDKKHIGIALGLALLLPACGGKNSAGEKAARDTVPRLVAAAERYKADCGQYPGKAEDLSKDPGVAGWDGPYYSTIVDPWGVPYQIELIDEQLHVWSSGPDRVVRTEDDISN